MSPTRPHTEMKMRTQIVEAIHSTINNENVLNNDNKQLWIQVNKKNKNKNNIKKQNMTGFNAVRDRKRNTITPNLNPLPQIRKNPEERT